MNTIRNIIGLLIILSILPLYLSGFSYVSKIGFDYDQINDEIALCQLRENLLIAYDLNYQSDCLSFRYKNKDFSLSLVNNKLLLQPGTQIYLNNIDSLYFTDQNNIIYVCYTKNNKEFKRPIIAKQGIYLDEFSDCDVVDDEYSDIQE